MIFQFCRLILLIADAQRARFDVARSQDVASAVLQNLASHRSGYTYTVPKRNIVDSTKVEIYVPHECSLAFPCVLGPFQSFCVWSNSYAVSVGPLS